MTLLAKRGERFHVRHRRFAVTALREGLTASSLRTVLSAAINVKEIRLNAFDMNCVVHQSAGLWRHPRDRAEAYKYLEYSTDLARVLEAGKFDATFLADVTLNDPALVIPATAYVTEHLGLAFTGTLSFEPPYPFARRLSTLDHLTKGRVAWNIVASVRVRPASGTISAQ